MENLNVPQRLLAYQIVMVPSIAMPAPPKLLPEDLLVEEKTYKQNSPLRNVLTFLHRKSH
jgi:hypothetical protein